MCGLHSQSYHTYCVTEGCCLLLLLLSLFMLLSLLLLLSACCWLAITCTVYLQHSVLSPAAKTVQVEPYHPYMRPGTLITAPCSHHPFYNIRVAQRAGRPTSAAAACGHQGLPACRGRGPEQKLETLGGCWQASLWCSHQLHPALVCL